MSNCVLQVVLGWLLTCDRCRWRSPGEGGDSGLADVADSQINGFESALEGFRRAHGVVVCCIL